MSSRALTALLHGKGAHADPRACIEDIEAELAARHVEGFPHSIAELVFHMNYWMDYELRRIRGEKFGVQIKLLDGLRGAQYRGGKADTRGAQFGEFPADGFVITLRGLGGF